jgi:hypothetical protein
MAHGCIHLQELSGLDLECLIALVIRSLEEDPYPVTGQWVGGRYKGLVGL